MRRLCRRDVLAAGIVGVGAVLTGCSADSGVSTNASPSPTIAGRSSPGTTSPAATPAMGPGPDITHGPSSGQLISLTFHGQGDPAIAQAVLDQCASAGARITVFAVGQWATAHPDLIRKIAASGHDVGNHTWSHQTMPNLTNTVIYEEISRCAHVLQEVLGYPGRWFRPSGTRFSTEAIRVAAQRVGYPRCISYNVDPLDYQDPGASAVRARVKAGAAPGAVVSLHLGHPGTVEALPGVLGDLRSRGLRPVTVTELLSA